MSPATTPPRPSLPQAKGEELPQISRWEHLAKTALTDYLQSCITGPRKTFFARFAPYSQSWTVRTDVAWNAQNPLDITVQIARFYEDVPQALPQILIRTTGHTGTQQSLGSFAFGERRVSDGMQQVGVVESYVVPVEMACAAGDPDGVDYLAHFLETALGPQARFIHNYQLFPSEVSRRNWCVFLPMTWSVGQLTDAPIGEDRKNRLWTVMYSFETRVEVATWSEYETSFAAYEVKTATTVIAMPSEVHVGSTTPLSISGLRPGDAVWRVNDYHIGIITGNGALYAKRPGVVTVQLASNIKNTVYTSKTITVIP